LQMTLSICALPSGVWLRAGQPVRRQRLHPTHLSGSTVLGVFRSPRFVRTESIPSALPSASKSTSGVSSPCRVRPVAACSWNPVMAVVRLSRMTVVEFPRL